MSSGATVDLDAVAKHFDTDAGQVRAVNGISVSIEAADSVAITGPSGCGKSTLLSLIGGLEAPSSGRVVIDGSVVSEMDDAQRTLLRRERLGFVFQSHNLQPYLTAVENVSLQLALTGSADGYERSLQLLGLLGLEAAADKYPDQLSGGERQRVAVARALVHGPGLVLADEPTGSLDADNSLGVLEQLQAVQSEVGATLIVITHDRDIAARLDRRLALSDGKVAADSLSGETSPKGNSSV